MSGKKQVTVVLMYDEEDGSYTAFMPLFPECTTSGDSLEKALAAARESLQLHLECTGDEDLETFDIAYSPTVVVSSVEVEVPQRAGTTP